MSRANYFIRVADDFLSLIFPRVCQSCGDHLVQNEKVVCINCLADMPFTSYHLERENNLEKELWGRCYVERATAMCFYRRGSRVQRLVHRLKYNGIKDIGIYLGEYYGSILKNSGFLESIDLIIPVPLHPSKIRRRGFNQSLVIATGISNASGIDIVNNVLQRSLKSSSQTRKSRVERWENVEGIFEITNDSTLINMHVLLVDDVITTGSTVEACVLVLNKIKGVKVSVAALATAVQ